MGIANSSSLTPLTSRTTVFGRLYPGTGAVNVLCYSTRTGSGCRTSIISSRLAGLNCAIGICAITSAGRVTSMAAATYSRISTVCIPASGALTSTATTMGRVTRPTKVPVVTNRRNVYGNYNITALSVDCRGLNRITNRVTTSVLRGNAGPTSVRVGATAGLAGGCITSHTRGLNVAVPSSCITVSTWSGFSGRWVDGCWGTIDLCTRHFLYVQEGFGCSIFSFYTSKHDDSKRCLKRCNGQYLCRLSHS